MLLAGKQQGEGETMTAAIERRRNIISNGRRRRRRSVSGNDDK